MRITAHGHPRITAGHTKTFELTEDEDIGPRATCVIGVGARVEGAWPDGPVELTITAGEYHQNVLAAANSFGRGLVVRKSDFLGDDTLAINADTAASELDRALVRALQDSATTVTVDVRSLGPPPRRAVFSDTDTPPTDETADADEILATTALGQIRACAAIAGAGPALLLTDLPKAATARKAALAQALAAAPVVVWRGRAQEAGALLALPGAVVAVDRGEAATRVVRQPPTTVRNDAIVTVAVPGHPEEGPLGPVIKALQAEGVSARTLRQALHRVGIRWNYDA